MKKEKKLKLFIIPIITIIILLVLQALCDLKLPEIMSDIINNGIQNNGITTNIPEVLTEDLYYAILKFSDNDLGIMASYDLIIKDNLSTQDQDKFTKKYPLLEKENLYILNPRLTKEEQLELEKKLMKPLTIAIALSSKTASSYFPNISFINEPTVLKYVLSLDEKNYINFISGIEDEFNKLDESMLKETSKLAVKKTYEIVGIDINHHQIAYIMNKGLKMLGIAFLGMFVAILTGYFISKLAARISYFLRKKTVSKILQLSTAEFKEFGASSLITRATNDIEQIKNFCIMLLRIIIFAPIMGIGAFIKVSDNPLNWLIGLSLLILFAIILFLLVFAMPKFKSLQKLIDKMNLVSREIITGMPVIRTFNNETHEEERYDKANKKLTRTTLFVSRTMGLMMPSMMLIMNLISIAIVWYGAKQIDLGTLQVGSLLAFITYTIQIIMSFLMISLVSIILPRALVSIKRIKEILDKKVSVTEKEHTTKWQKDQHGIIEFKDVYFKYPDADEAMLKNISFKAIPGTTTAFIGSTGSGKSTLVNLIPRFFDTTKGDIYVNGVNIKDVSLKELRNIIGYVPQQGMLFSGTIESNLKLGTDDLSEEEMKECAKVSQSLEFIQEKDGQFSSSISSGGSNVSGGQRQRLSIARAIAKNPEIYIFDDSFSALDFKTDANLRKQLKKHAKNATILIVAQRINTIMNADNIIVLNEGEIVGSGTHTELMKTCDIYKEIALSQMKESEL